MASTLVSGTTAQVAQPILVEVNNDRERQVAVFRKMLRFTAFLAFPAMFGLAMVAHEFIIVLVSEKWMDSILLLQILCVSGAFLPFYTLYQNLMISRGKSDIYMWCTIALIVLQIGLMAGCYAKGIVFMVSVYTAVNILWLFVWQYFANREIGVRLFDVMLDICPYLFITLAVMVATYFLTMPVSNLVDLLLMRIVVAGLLYLLVMKLTGSRMLDECIGYFRRNKG